MSESRCIYHPDRIAVKKCEDCGKSICLDCSRVHSFNHSRGGKYNHRVVEKVDLCLPCNNLRIERDTPFVSVLLIFFALIYTGIPLFIASMIIADDGPIFILIFISIFIIIGVSLIVKGIKDIITLPGKKENARREREEFEQNLS